MYTSILIGYDDHLSVYIVNEQTLESLQGMYDVHEVTDVIVEQGQRIDAGINYNADVFLDNTDSNLNEFHDQVATALVIPE